MKTECVKIEERECLATSFGVSSALLIQPCDESDAKELGAQTAGLSEMTDVGFIHVAFPVENWNDDLSPWQAPPVFGKQGFGGGADKTLEYIRTDLVPEIRARYALDGSVPVVIGGYSLAALFSLWAAYVCPDFSAAAAASPSVWFPGWIDFALAGAPIPDVVYLSLGDREEMAKNPVMATVGDCIRKQYSHLGKTPGKLSTLEWNEGNHFKDAGVRTAKWFAWCLNNLKKCKKI